jgi:hypothetical protein
MSKHLYPSASSWLQNPCDYTIGLDIFSKLSRNRNLIKILSLRPNQATLEYELGKLIKDFQSSDAEIAFNSNSDSEDSSSDLKELDLETKKTWLTNLWKPVYKDMAQDHAELSKLYALKLAGGDEKAIEKQAQELAGCILEKVNYCTDIWNVLLFIEDHKAYPENVVIEEFGKQKAIAVVEDSYLLDLASKSDIELVKLQNNCRSNISRKSTKPDLLPVWKNRLYVIDEELKKRGNH